MSQRSGHSTFRGRLSFLFSCFVCSAAVAAKAPEGLSASTALFTNGAVLQIRLELPAGSLESLKKESRKFVRGAVHEGGHVFTNVGIHLKGVGSFQPIEEKPSFTLKFNEFASGQRFHGLTRISLNNSIQDPTYLNEALCTVVFREAGVPAARVAHARVWLNDRPLGLYVLVEGLSKDFLKLNFKNSDGPLYEPYVQDIDEELKQVNGKPENHTALDALLKATRVADASARWKALEKALDLERFISMMACEILMAHWDGYWMNHNNYRIYNDTSHHRMVLIPYGLDSMFQQPTMPLRPPKQTLLVQAVLQTTEGQRRYRQRITALHDGLFKTESLQERLDDLAKHIRPVLAADPPKSVKGWEAAVATLRGNIAARMRFLTEELAQTGPMK